MVTGATGFVGRRLIRLLAEAYGASRILCLAYDRADNDLERAGRAILDEAGIRYIPVDLVSGRGLANVPKSPSLVLHLASNTDTGASNHTVNDIGTRNLLAAIQPLSPDTHFIFASTIAVADHREDIGRPVNEETPLLRPFNDYGRRKLAAEVYLRERARADGFRATIVRLCAVYGRGTRTDGLFGRLSQMAYGDSVIARFNYPGRLSLIDVDDIARILVLLSRRSVASGTSEVYRFGRGEFVASGTLVTPRLVAQGAALPDGRVVLSGGLPLRMHEFAPLSEVEIWDPRTELWTALPSAPTARAWGSIVTVRGVVYQLSGTGDGETAHRTIERLAFN